MDDTLETLEESPPPLHYISVILPRDMGKQSQLLLQPTEVELGLQVGVEFDKNWSELGLAQFSPNLLLIWHCLLACNRLKVQLYLNTVLKIAPSHNEKENKPS